LNSPGLLGGEVAAGVHGPPEAGVDGLDRVRGADDRPDFPVEPQERHEFGPVLQLRFFGR
jgi:hypothetical protein